MRVTNLMMTNNSLYNLQKQEQRLNTLDQQYNTQKKISSPSEDPIIATRALKLNTTYSEVTQYLDKNIPDASAWMSMTQSALDNTQSILTSIYEKCVQGNTDGLSDTDRNAIATSLAEYKDQVYQEGTSSYSGRYLFTGFKTDTNLIFTEPNEDRYTISEPTDMDSMDSFSAIINGSSPNSTSADAANSKVPTRVDYQRIRLAYDDTELGSKYEPTFTLVDADGNETANSPISVTNSYETYDDFIADVESGAIADSEGNLNANAVIYIADKGEMVLGEDAAQTMKKTYEDGNTVNITYQKKGFAENDLRPEHYFTCERIVDEGLSTEKTYQYNYDNQEIKYLVNYNQQMTVNVQAKDCYTHDMGRDIDDLVNIVNDCITAEDTRDKLKAKMEACTEGTDDYNNYKELYENASVEYDLRSKIMQEAFADNEAAFKQYAINFSGQATNVGSREQRLELIQTRLENQQADVEELQSENIDVDLSEIIVRYTSAYDVYQAALSGTAKSITDTLLTYL